MAEVFKPVKSGFSESGCYAYWLELGLAWASESESLIARVTLCGLGNDSWSRSVLSSALCPGLGQVVHVVTGAGWILASCRPARRVEDVES